MVAITPLRGTQLYIKVGNGASPEVFAHPCLINAKRGIKFSSSTNKQIIPDCDNPDDPAWSQAIKDAISATIDGAGVLDNKLAVIQFYDSWLRDPDPRNVKVYLGTVGHWDGAFDLTNFELGGDRGENVAVTLTLESNGVLTTFAA